MSKHSQQNNRKKRLLSNRQLVRWHRRIGVICALFVILLCITGILLNHNAVLGLQHITINNEWIRSLYGFPPLPAPAEQSADHFSPYSIPQLSLDRLLLDLHSGRLFGKTGVYLMDAAAIGLLLLSITGLIVWLRRRKSETS